MLVKQYILRTIVPITLPFSVYKEGGYPTHIADRLNTSIPLKLAFLLHVRSVEKIAAADK